MSIQKVLKILVHFLKILVKWLIFRKAASSVTNVVNYPTGFCTLLFQSITGNTSQWVFSFLLMLSPLNVFKTNFFINICWLKFFLKRRLRASAAKNQKMWDHECSGNHEKAIFP